MEVEDWNHDSVQAFCRCGDVVDVSCKIHNDN